MRLVALILGVCVFVWPGQAHAASIGSFTWVYDELLGSGSTFSVSNDSANAFDDVLVDLYAPAAATPFYTVSLGDIAAGESAQSIDVLLSLLIVPFDFGRGVLRLSYLDAPVGAELLASDLLEAPSLFFSGTADILAADVPPPNPVPEPATWLLCALGFGAARGRVLLARRRRRASSPLSQVNQR